ncbi:MAG TPA: hypothetical protein PLQ45_08225 [Anaerohalosphaeraceae bacterium]|jgi:uncharacterized repeat protein (TIGR04138 family)|nr:hypothetical protein [Anaerohalosphaeraceae bacterium]
MKKTIDQIARIDGRYDPKALKFIFEGLAETIDKIRKEEGSEDKPRHITGQELAGGLGELASRRWGRLAGMVLGQWGVHTTRDFGEIVYLMIAHNWMTCQETDTIDDFNNVFDFKTVFEDQYSFDIR